MKTLFFSFIALLLIVSQNLFSYPRFSAYTGDKCADCHVNPQGGGMRNQYGQHFAKQNLQMDFLKKLVTKKTNFSTQLNKNISIGGDVRIVHVGNENTSGPSTNTFLTMQGDFYANANVNDYISVYVAPGLQIPNIPTKYEVYGMVGNLPANIYFRAGRMTPTYGMKVVEHRAYQRQSLLGTPYAANDGVEIGLSPGFVNFSAGLFNGLNTSFFDNDPKRMFVSSADFTFIPVEDKFNVNFGASFFNNPYNFLDPVSGTQTDAIKQAFGGFAKFGLFKRIALLGEVDFLENTQLSSMTRGIFGFGELNVIIVNGVELRTQYEIMKPDRDEENNRTIRTSVGAALFPLTGFETEAMVRFVSDDRQPNTTEFQWSFHFYF
ncbi:MAG: hypothetical protein L0Y76_00120 [Ignavibacteria bacterium]|nr:hypothetical protein [Ignavibacteria bacterium]